MDLPCAAREAVECRAERAVRARHARAVTGHISRLGAGRGACDGAVATPAPRDLLFDFRCGSASDAWPVASARLVTANTRQHKTCWHSQRGLGAASAGERRWYCGWGQRTAAGAQRGAAQCGSAGAARGRAVVRRRAVRQE